MFSAETYVNRRQRLKAQLKSGLILLLGNDDSPMNYRDNPFHFRQDSTFLYFFGLNAAGLAAVIDLDKDQEIIFGDELTIDDIVWMGNQPTLAEKARLAGVTQTAPPSRLAEVIKQVRQRKHPVHYLPPYRPEHVLKLFSLLDIHPAKATESASVELIQAVVGLRNIKSAEEIIEIDKAVAISAEMHLRAMQLARPGMTETQIAAAVQEVAMAAGGNIAFPIIATIHGETLHNHYHGNVLKKGELFLLDTGAETAEGYAGDLSSTFPVDTRFTSRQKEVYQVQLRAHAAAVAALKPGLPFKEVHLLTCRTIAQDMKELGFMKGDVGEAVAQGAHAMFMPCGTGHMMGLDVHDMENLGEKYVGYAGKDKSAQFGLKSLRLARELQPGFVLTIEPGVYFIPELIDLWKAEKRHSQFINYEKLETYKDFGGVRNEENYVITETGARRLGKELPMTIDGVEAVRATSTRGN